MCDHLYETTSRYDSDRKLLSLLLVCPVCEIEEIVHTIEYAPTFVANAAHARHQLPPIRRLATCSTVAAGMAKPMPGA
jgi:hypothetical protein